MFLVSAVTGALCLRSDGGTFIRACLFCSDKRLIAVTNTFFVILHEEGNSVSLTVLQTVNTISFVMDDSAPSISSSVTGAGIVLVDLVVCLIVPLAAVRVPGPVVFCLHCSCLELAGRPSFLHALL